MNDIQRKEAEYLALVKERDMLLQQKREREIANQRVERERADLERRKAEESRLYQEKLKIDQGNRSTVDALQNELSSLEYELVNIGKVEPKEESRYNLIVATLNDFETIVREREKEFLRIAGDMPVLR